MTNHGWKAGLLGLALLAGLGVICPLLAAPYIPLTGADEGRLAAIAQKMVESGDWIVPRLLDEPFLERPILYFWAMAASLKVFGMSEAAVRLPGFLFGMLGTLTTTAFAWRLLGRRTGLIAGLFYASMVLPLALVQLPGYDAALVTWVNLALLCFWESERDGLSRQTQAGCPRDEPQAGCPHHEPQAGCLHHDGRAWAWTAAAGVVLGLAILTKGLVGVVVVGIAYGGYLIVSRRLRVIVHGFRAILALAAAASVSAWWYLAMEHAHPGYLHYYFFDRHLLGVLTHSQPHGHEPWWYYFPVLIVGGLPWAGYLPVLVRDTVNRRRNAAPAVTDARGNRPLLLLGCWCIGCTIFFMLSRSKLVTYVWPVFPAMAMLAAIVWARKIDGALSGGANRWMGRIVWLTCMVGLLALPATLAITQIALPTRFSRPAWGLAVAAALTSLAPLWSWVRGRDRLTLGLAVTTVCGQLAVLLACALPQVAAALSGRDLADYFNRTRELPSRVLLVREQIPSVVFYLDPDLRRQLRFGQMANQDFGMRLPSPALGRDERIVVAERYVHRVSEDCDLSSLPYERAGRFRLYRRSDIESRARIGRADGPLLR